MSVPYPIPTVSTQWQSSYGASSTESCLYYDMHGNLNVELTLDGTTILPDYRTLVREVHKHANTPINISLWHWPNIELSPSLQPHLYLLYSVFNRWHTARFDIPLLNSYHWTQSSIRSLCSGLCEPSGSEYPARRVGL